MFEVTKWQLTSDVADLGNTVAVTEDNTDLTGGGAVTIVRFWNLVASRSIDGRFGRTPSWRACRSGQWPGRGWSWAMLEEFWSKEWPKRRYPFPWSEDWDDVRIWDRKTSRKRRWLSRSFGLEMSRRAMIIHTDPFWMLMCAEENCLSVGVGRLVEYGMKVFKKWSRTSSVNFWWWSVDHVTCLGGFANELAFCGRIAYRLLHFLGSADNCLIFSFNLSSDVITQPSLKFNNAMQKQRLQYDWNMLIGMYALFPIVTISIAAHLMRHILNVYLFSGTSCFSGALTSVGVASMYKPDFWLFCSQLVDVSWYTWRGLSLTGLKISFRFLVLSSHDHDHGSKIAH